MNNQAVKKIRKYAKKNFQTTFWGLYNDLIELKFIERVKWAFRFGWQVVFKTKKKEAAKCK